jgi:phosphoribosyl 1,2-cyclic phosphodiesterase
MRLIILGSGSSGNSVYVESGGASVLVDVGLSAKETARRMVGVGLDPCRLTAILVTHEHSDHFKGVPLMSRTAGVPVFMSYATRAVCRFNGRDEGMQWGEAIASSRTFQVGPLEVHPFTIPHDGVDTVAFTLQSEGVKVAIVTDLGYITQLVSERLKGSNLVVIESNHDRDMLKVGRYPWSVKQRIASNLGHLANDETARWIRNDFDGQAEYLVLAHLSRHCNHPELVRLAALQALDAHGSLFFRNAEQRVRIARHDRVSEWFEF